MYSDIVLCVCLIIYVQCTVYSWFLRLILYIYIFDANFKAARVTPPPPILALL